MLKRYWVKYDKNLDPVHPDTEDFHCILPWRPTEDLVPKLGLDVDNWKSELSPWVKWYQKAFSLLIDACANKEAHCMIMNAMAYVRSMYPIDVEDAESGYSWELHANAFKLGKEFDSSLIASLPRSSVALKAIASRFLTRPYHVI